MLENLFTPEVIERFLTLLTTAAQGGVYVAIIWVMLPIFTLLLASGAWLLGIYLIINRIKTIILAYLTNRIELLASKVKLKELEKVEVKGAWEFGKHLISDADAPLLIEIVDLMKTVRGGSRWLHKSDLRALKLSVSDLAEGETLKTRIEGLSAVVAKKETDLSELRDTLNRGRIEFKYLPEERSKLTLDIKEAEAERDRILASVITANLELSNVKDEIQRVKVVDKADKVTKVKKAVKKAAK